MKILMIIHRYPISGGAGAENYTRYLCDSLSQHHRVHVVTRHDSRQGSYCSTTSSSELGYPVTRFNRHRRDTDRLEKNYWNPDLDEPFRKILRDFQPDIIHFQHCIGLSATWIQVALNTGIPVFMTLHDYWFVCPGILMLDATGSPCESWESPSRCWKCQWKQHPGPRIFIQGLGYMKKRKARLIPLLKQCKRVFAPSNTLRQIIIDSGIEPDRVAYWPHTVAAGALPEKKSRDHPLHSPLRIGYIGTFAPQKGIDILLKAFRTLATSHAELRLYGDMNQSISIRKNVREWRKHTAGDTIRFMGKFPQNEIDRIHRELDFLVAPSIWYENRPLAILEAFSMGNPVLGSGFGGIRELVSPLGTPWTFRRADPDDLARKLDYLIAHPEEIILAREKLPDIISPIQETEKLESIYREYLSE